MVSERDFQNKPVPQHELQTVPLFPEPLRKELERETITSLLDLDLYKMTMGQFVFDHYPDVPVKYEFINRTKSVKLADFIPQDILEAQLSRIQNIKISDEEIEYLRTAEIRGQKLFREDYLQFLKNMELPKITVSREDGQYKIGMEGPWASNIYWETLVLSTVNELFYRTVRYYSGKNEEEVKAEGERRLDGKIAKLKEFIDSEKREGREGPFFMDFGTRRRYAGDWQKYAIAKMAKAIPYNFTGTSNVLLGKELGLPIKGTFAHEMDMIFSGIFYDEDDRAGTFESHDRMMDMWYEEYGAPLSVALTDTYGSEFFFEHFTHEQAEKWIGIRQDSGDPYEFGENAIAFYEKMGIDPKEKTIVFSDGLDVDAIIDIYNRFKGKIRMIFGWGTTLTNDVGFNTLSLVVKATEANGHGTAKLSDNIAKAVGKQEDKERAIRLSHYHHTYSKEPKV